MRQVIHFWVRNVAREFGLEPEDLCGKSLGRHFTVPRQIAMAMAVQDGHTLKAVGRYFGGRDHTTVIHAVRRFDDHLMTHGKRIDTIWRLAQPEALVFRSTRNPDTAPGCARQTERSPEVQLEA